MINKVKGEIGLGRKVIVTQVVKEEVNEERTNRTEGRCDVEVKSLGWWWWWWCVRETDHCLDG